jgi:hypothetical protein
MYFEETEFLSLKSSKKSAGRLRAIHHVVESQSDMQRKVLVLLAKEQLYGQSANSKSKGVLFRKFAQLCEEELMGMSQRRLRGNIKDFQDHDIVRVFFDSRSQEKIMIPFPQDVIESEILNHKDSS